jgi:DNA-binding transcriptional ArsR family regulator
MDRLDQPGAGDSGRDSRRLLPPDPVSLSQVREQLAPARVYGSLRGLKEVVCEPSRLMIIAALRAGELSSGDLAIVIDRRPPTTSQHLRVLRELRLVVATRRHRGVYYRLGSSPEVSLVLSILEVLERQR